ncbi:hypothetical protein HDA40_005420 [Hamadaea flava]|uniref:Uncharacterized protein n=1 Tax=Hamadaea flava TaxID=1742688 RepID=A0ABV8M0B9_9ACTN|nr:hypothetical protein [Hamadaea flava]MCP2326913.1 hypothetical protein [Hamadaea flava]
MVLSYVGDGFGFSRLGTVPESGFHYVAEDISVPGPGNPDQGSVGIGMAGAGSFVMPTAPTAVFRASPFAKLIRPAGE